MKTTIYYLSATGNSLKVANELKKGLEDVELISVKNALKNKTPVQCSDRVGFVFPLYYQGFPPPVKEFIENGHFKEAKYIFCVVTRGTSPTGGVISHLKDILGEKALKLDSGFYVNMPCNDITSFFNVPRKEKQNELLHRSETRIKEIVQIILEQKQQFDFEPLKFLRFIRYPHYLKRLKHSYKNFRVDSNCKQCGVCQKVCVTEAIETQNGKPVWNSNCIECEACINLCPQKAIQYGNITLKKRRYHHPEYSADKLAQSIKLITSKS